MVPTIQYKRSCYIFRTARAFRCLLALALFVATAGDQPHRLGDSDLLGDEGVALLQTRAGVVKRVRSGFEQVDVHDGDQESLLDVVNGDVSGEEPVDNVLSGLGRSACLDEEGYAAVANLKEDDEMEEFVRRLAAQLGCTVIEDGGLKGFVPFYSGDDAQSFATLKAELLKISQVAGAWLIPNADVVARKGEEQLAQQGNSSEANAKTFSNGIGSDREVPIEGSEADQQVVSDKLPLMQDNATDLVVNDDNISAISGSSIPLDELEKSNMGPEEESMMESESETDSFDSHYHAGDAFVATMNATRMLWQIPTIWDPRSTLQRFNSFTVAGGPSGVNAAFSQKGYREVVVLNNATEMALFARRVLEDLDYEIKSEDGLMHFVTLYCNTTEQNYTSFRAGIVSASKVADSWVAPQDHGPSTAQMLMGAIREIRELALQTIANNS